LKRYLDKNYDVIGLGGLAKSVHSSGTVPWLNRCFDIICDAPNRLPKSKVHGFGISSVRLWLKYPWYSVDSTSIHKKAAYGWTLVPYKRKGMFVFDEPPLHVSFSDKSPLMKENGKHYTTFTNIEKEIMEEWLKKINIPLGGEGTPGVMNDGTMRKLALYSYYEQAAKAMPDYPWAFPVQGKGLKL